MKTKTLSPGLVRVATRDKTFPVHDRVYSADGISWRAVPVANRTATLELYVNIEEILWRLGSNAVKSKSGRSAFMRGAVVVVAHSMADEPLKSEAPHA